MRENPILPPFSKSYNIWNMKIIPIPGGPIGTNAWLLINEENSEAILFDAPPESYHPIKKEVETYNCSIKALFVTHGHWDHILDATLFAADNIPIYGHKDGEILIEHPESMRHFALDDLKWQGTSITHYVHQGDILTIAGIGLEVRTAPGHCPGSIIIYMEDLEMAIVGDVIFDGSIGRTDLPEGDFEQLKSGILQQVYTLPDNTVLCPGHGGSTTVKKEKKTNPFVRLEI